VSEKVGKTRGFQIKPLSSCGTLLYKFRTLLARAKAFSRKALLLKNTVHTHTVKGDGDL
jgi:hypothetical protein